MGNSGSNATAAAAEGEKAKDTGGDAGAAAAAAAAAAADDTGAAAAVSRLPDPFVILDEVKIDGITLPALSLIFCVDDIQGEATVDAYSSLAYIPNVYGKGGILLLLRKHFKDPRTNESKRELIQQANNFHNGPHFEQATKVPDMKRANAIHHNLQNLDGTLRQVVDQTIWGKDWQSTWKELTTHADSRITKWKQDNNMTSFHYRIEKDHEGAYPTPKKFRDIRKDWESYIDYVIDEFDHEGNFNESSICMPAIYVE